MVKPVSVIAYLAVEPLRNLTQMVNELSVKVLNAPFNLALVLRVRRMSKMRLNATLTAPVFPLLLKLRSMIRQNSLRKTLLPLQHRYCFSRRELMIKLLCRYNEPAVVIDADQKPVFLALDSEWSLEVDLPKLIRLFGPKEVPALKLTLITVLIVPC
jgi:hypothetical protein